MKTTLTLFALLLSTLFCVAQEDTDTTVVPFVAYWSTGDSYDFKVTKLIKKWVNGMQVKEDSSSYVANFEVLDSTDTSYTIQWSFETNLGEFEIPLPLLEKFPQYKTTKVIYKTTELGEFVDIVNWREIAASMKGLKKELAKSLAKKMGTDAKNLEKQGLPYLEIYESKQGIELLLLQELHYFHSPFGVEYETKEPILYEDELPNLFGGTPITAAASVEVQTVDFNNYHCTLLQKMQADKADVKRAISEVYEQATPDKKQLMEKASLDMTDYNIFSFYYYPGIPTFIETQRHIAVKLAGATSRGLNVVRIELLP